MKGVYRQVTVIGMLLALVLPGLCVAADPLTIDTAPLLAIGTVDLPYTEQLLSASGGTSPYSWKASGILPPGLTVSSAGVVSGTPTSGGNYNFLVKVTDALSATASKQMFLNISSGRVVLPETMPSRYGNCTNCHAQPTPGAPVTTISSFPPSPSNSTEAAFTFESRPATYTVKTECSMDGELFVTCTSPITYYSLSDGSHTFMVRSIGDAGEIESPPASYSWGIYTVPLAIATDSLPNAMIGAPYGQALSATGSTPPFTWYIPPGYLPAGLSLDPATGVISGTPSSTPGHYEFVAQVTDPFNTTVMKQLSIQIVAQPLIITTESLPSGFQGAAYNQTLTASGGMMPYNWTVQSGSLPAGLSLAQSTGVISGTPSVSGSFSSTFRVTDAVNALATKSLTIVIAPLVKVPPDATYSSLQEAFNNVPNNGTIQAMATTFIENVVLNRLVAITLKGGYEPTYTSNGGVTVLQGTLTVQRGSLSIENVAIR
ncbi:putative Ig domain-containing protein [Geobacter pelophilus]|uniref:Ig domain-containing protein n=1 Tax=Geoanaerobacter pelophilus TaxID=60036 RepID=A0AAW4L6J8_9BACT|nr:Ig domain-containing protein [Geoanaerobacter pelophilus]MBT0663846.1 putative Ig domain-containing protein [Geoanaerobacter pelophilus]